MVNKRNDDLLLHGLLLDGWYPLQIPFQFSQAPSSS